MRRQRRNLCNRSHIGLHQGPPQFIGATSHGIRRENIHKVTGNGQVTAVIITMEIFFILCTISRNEGNSKPAIIASRRFHLTPLTPAKADDIFPGRLVIDNNNKCFIAVSLQVPLGPQYGFRAIQACTVQYFHDNRSF